MKRNLLLIVVVIILVLVIAFAVTPRSYYSEVETNPILQRLHRDLKELNPEYGKIPLKSCDSAYTENKSMICICTHDPKTKKQYGHDILMYVCLHELTHMVCKDYGHGVEFQSNFGTILRAAVEKGLYDPNTVIPPDYGGISN